MEGPIAINTGPSDSSLWRDVCLASAWFDRARTQFSASTTAISSTSSSPSLSQINGQHQIITPSLELTSSSAEKALSLYQSCYRRVRKRSIRFAPPSAGTTTTSGTTPSPGSSSRKKLTGTTTMALQNSKSFTINLELRMAQILRFLALVHTTKNMHAPTAIDDEDAIANLDVAIKFHDSAVSLLVGVFDDTEGGDDDYAEEEADHAMGDTMGLAEGKEDMEPQGDMSASAISEDDSQGRGDFILLSIRVPYNAKLSEHFKSTSKTNDASASPAASITATQTIKATFLLPSEDQRVRAIAVSLNALAQLHAKCGDDRAAMDAYREALEILRAATEEGRNDDEFDDDDGFIGGDEGWSEAYSGHSGVARRGGKSREGSSTPSRSEADLASTLMNVGNFHLRRDELDAALNAYSTVWALHTGNSMEGSISSHVHPSTPSSSGLSLPGLKQSPHFAPMAQSNSLGALVALNNLGIVHERRGELNDALSCHDHVRRVRIENFGADHFDVASSWVNIGNCHQRLQDWDNASRAYEEAILIYRKTLRQQQQSSNKTDNVVESLGESRLYRSLAGALRNSGTCFWKQRQLSESMVRLHEAVEMEQETISCLLKSGTMASGYYEGVQQSNESMAQLLGFLGCLYMEEQHTQMKLESFDCAEDAFKKAIEIYRNLGYSEHHPSFVWARKNLDVVMMMARHRNPPPPPSTPPPVKRRTPPPAISNADEVDSVDLDEIVASKDDEDSVFSGVEDDVDSKELDEFLSSSSQNDEREVQPAPRPNSTLVDETANHEHIPSFDEEVDLDEGFGNIEIVSGEGEVDLQISKPKALSYEHRNNSTSLFSEHSQQDRQVSLHSNNDNLNYYEENVRTQKVHYGNESIEAGRALVELAQHYWERNDRVTATELFTEAHAVFQRMLGDCKEVAMILKALGDINKDDGKPDAAKHLYMEALEIELDVHGHYLPQTLNAIGVLCLEEDDFRSAMEYHRRALQIQKKKSTSSTPPQSKYEMYETLVRIGNVYYSERNNLTNIRSKGVDYKEFIQSGFLGWIANAHEMRGEYVTALQFYEESLQISMIKDTKESKKETALTLNRLGSLSRELGRYDEAMDYHQKALHLQQSSSSVAKAMTAETCVLIGMVRLKIGDFMKALDLFEDSLVVLKSSLGKHHSSVAKTIAQIGAVHYELGEYNKAMSALAEAERCQMSTIGEQSRDRLETQLQIGRVLCSIGKFDVALEKMRDVAEKQISMFGNNHPSIAETNQCIGDCFLEQGMNTEARVMYVECYNMRRLFFSGEQIHIAESMVDIIRARDDRPERALEIYQNAMDIYKEYLPDDHVQIGRLFMFEGDTHAELLNFPAAIERYEQAMQIFLKKLGEGHVLEADISVNTGKVLLRKCDYDGAKEHFNTALQIYESKLPESHPKISSTLVHLDRVEQEEALCV